MGIILCAIQYILIAYLFYISQFVSIKSIPLIWPLPLPSPLQYPVFSISLSLFMFCKYNLLYYFFFIFDIFSSVSSLTDISQQVSPQSFPLPLYQPIRRAQSLVKLLSSLQLISSSQNRIAFTKVYYLKSQFHRMLIFIM